jgi:hypothetical protein
VSNESEENSLNVLINGCVGQKIKEIVQVGILKKMKMEDILLVIFLSKKILTQLNILI